MGYKSEIIFSVWSREGRYEARAVGYPICAHAPAMDELRVKVSDAVKVYFSRQGDAARDLFG